MPFYNAIALVFDLVLAVGIAFLIYGLLQKSLRELLNHVVQLPEATTFYLRAFILILACVAFGRVITGIHMKPDARFMEYVWAVASDISAVFQDLFIALLVYVGLITVVVVVLRPKNGK
ncbi:MAG: hypothetical protein LAO08_03895 [Acidobacteriia bacterium]|nr:hypothetical protein [Terriglobia bacterium]